MGTLSACGDKGKQTGETDNSVVTSVDDSEAGNENVVTTTPEILPLTFNNVVKQGGSIIMDIMYDNTETISLTPSNVEFPEGFKADLYIASDGNAEGVRSLVFSNIDAEIGEYTIKIKEGSGSIAGTPAPEFDFVIKVCDSDLSNYIQMTCSTSSTLIHDGEGLSIVCHYSNITDKKFITLNMSDDVVRLTNCTGKLEYTTANNGMSSCIIFSNVHADDMSKPCYIEILDGNAFDVDGTPINGVKIEFSVTDKDTPINFLE